MIASCLLPGLERDAIYATHPVVRNAVQIATQPVKEAEAAVRAAILHRDPGTYFLGEPRMGKTTTIEMIKWTLPQTFPGVPAFDFIAKSHVVSSEKTFFGDLLMELRQSVGSGSTAAYRRSLVFSHILAVCRTRGSDRAIIFIDEGQNWKEFEYELLRDLINDFRKANVVCITLIFAHPNLEHKVKVDLISKGRTDLTGRFLVSSNRFRGLRGAEELKDAFSAYDDSRRHEFPKGTKICYSEFFCPRSYRSGWRLSHEANTAWMLFAAISKASARGPVNLGMQWVSAAIRNFLFSLDDPISGNTGEIWGHSIKAAVYDAVPPQSF